MLNSKTGDNRIQLFCLPYGGTSASMYANWKNRLKESIEVVPIELPGRGTRYGEPLYNDFEDAIEDLFNNVNKIRNTDNVAFFGHCVGALYAYELAYMMEEVKHITPKRLFYSASRPPEYLEPKKRIYGFSDERFLEEILKTVDLPKELLNHKKMLKAYLSVLKVDFKTFETYDRDPLRNGKLGCGITAFHGSIDRVVSLEEITRLKDMCTGSFDIHIYEGEHFFINQFKDEMINVINNTLG